VKTLLVRRNLSLLLVALMALGFLSGRERDGARSIACVDPTSPEALFDNAANLALERDLFGRVKSEAQQEVFKRNALAMYNFLTQNELQYYLDVQAANSAYGIKGPLFHNFVPASVAQAAQLGGLGFTPTLQLTNLWSTMFQVQPSFQAPGLSPLGRMALMAPGPVGAVQAAKLGPIVAPRVSVSAVGISGNGIIRF
jgi:hypothetical protein